MIVALPSTTSPAGVRAVEGHRLAGRDAAQRLVELDAQPVAGGLGDEPWP